MITRRTLLSGAAAMATAPFLPRRSFAASPGAEILEAAAARVQIAPEGYPQTEIWSYGGTVPGTEIRARQGDRLRRKLVNSLS